MPAAKQRGDVPTARMATKKQGRAAAWAATAIFLVAGIGQFYAVLHAAFGVDPPPANDLIVAVLAGLLAVAAAAVLLIRVGYWRERVPFEVGRTGAWWVAYAGLGGAVLGFGGQMDAEWYIAGPINLITSLLAFVVARSELPEPPRSEAASSQSGKPGSPTPAR